MKQAVINQKKLLLIVLASFLIPVFVSAAMFVKYDGIDGEVEETSSDANASTLRVQVAPTVDSASVQGTAGNVKLNPQPEPPSASVKLNPQPDPPSAPGTEIEDIGAPASSDGTTSGNNRKTVRGHDFQTSDSGGDETRMNKADLIESISSSNSALRAVFIKFDDIKGESQDSAGGGGENEVRFDDTQGAGEAKKGNVEYTWKVEEGEKAVGGDGDIIITGGYSGKKPKEIVVVGSKVRGWDPKTKEEIVGLAPAEPAGVATLDDLGLFVVSAIDEDENIHDVTMTEDSVVVEYDQPGRLFGFIEARLTSKTTVTFGDGERGARVKVKFPWYSFLYRKTVSVNDLEDSILPEIDDEVLVGFESGDPAVHARVFQTLSNIMKTKHDTAMAAIRNLK